MPEDFKPSIQSRIDNSLADIDALIDAQLARGPVDDYSANYYPEQAGPCPWCPEGWHGLAITARMVEMRGRGFMDESYRYDEDDSYVLCPGSDFHGPEHVSKTWDKRMRESPHYRGVAAVAGRPRSRIQEGDIVRHRASGMVLPNIVAVELTTEEIAALENEALLGQERYQTSRRRGPQFGNPVREPRYNWRNDREEPAIQIDDERVHNRNNPNIKRFRFNPKDWREWQVRIDSHIDYDDDFPPWADRRTRIAHEEMRISIEYIGRELLQDLDINQTGMSLRGGARFMDFDFLRWNAFLYGYIIYSNDHPENTVERRPDEPGFVEMDLFKNPLSHQFWRRYWSEVPRTGVVGMD